MSQFSYSFCLSLFHSLWQCALLLAFYSAIQIFIKKQLPSFKRNILYGLLFAQIIISCITFFIYYNGFLHFYRDIINENFSTLLVKQPLIEKLSPWIISIYTLIIFFKSILLIYNWYRFKSVCKSTLLKPTVDLKLFTFKKANEFGITRKVTLWFSNAVSTPLTYGFLKPVILMPVALLNRLSIAEAESLIIHELTHIKNNDYLLNWLLVIAETLFFYNPFIKIIAGKIKLEREKNCDVQVLHYQYPVINYAETLLKAAKFKSNINYFPLAAVFKNKQLLQRIHFFTSDHNLVFSKRKYSAVSFSVIVTALLINLVILLQVKNNTNSSDKLIAAIPQLAPIATDKMHPIAEAIAGANDFATAIIPAVKKRMDEQVKGIDVQEKKTTVAVKQFEKQIAEQNFQVSYAVPVVNIQPEEKEMIVQEETSGTSEAVTKAYKVKLKNGKWKDELVYVLKEGKPTLPAIVMDSIFNLKDSLIIKSAPSIKYIPSMQ
ncbi:MAG: M56 family metallopeptidase [Ferruginibacter sp.]